MTGERKDVQGSDPDLVLMLARRTLLNAFEALLPHLDALILVGAQAVYLHTGDADLAVAPFTSDADLALNPGKLGDEPALETALEQAGFSQRDNPGTWISEKEGIEVDLMVPAALSPKGRRGARLHPPHGDRAARKARGLEAALIDAAPMRITALDPDDARTFEVAVAGPAALLVAKLHKLADRQGNASRLEAKDALDVYRILKVVPTTQLRATFDMLSTSQIAGQVTTEAVTLLGKLFGTAESPGVILTVQAAGILENPDELALACTSLARALLNALDS